MINIHDRGTIEQKLREVCRLMAGNPMGYPSIHIYEATVASTTAKAIKVARRKHAIHCGVTGRYGPHQGAKECARRVRQGLAGHCHIKGWHPQS